MSKLIFKANQKYLYKKNGVLFFIDRNESDFAERSGNSLSNKMKLFLKRMPRFFMFFYYIVGASFVGKGPRAVINGVSDEKLILNLGSGTKIVRKDVINVDAYPFSGVNIVADISDLPFADNSIDIIISEYTLEHVKNPLKVMQEIHRVLKPDGKIYITVPFVAGFHSSPNDFYRWSKQGLKELLGNFKEIDCGIRSGPTSAMNYIISEWLATLLSFGISFLQQCWFMLFLVILAPLKLFDYVIYKLPSSENIAYGFYFIGKKK